MTSVDRKGLIRRAAGWPARHPSVVRFGWGVFSGCTYGPLLLGGVVVGYVVGKAPDRLANLASACLGLLAGFAVITALFVIDAVNSGCPSCVDTLIVAPATLGILFVPLGIGYWLGRRAWDRTLDRGEPQGAEDGEPDPGGAAQSDWRGAGWLSGALAVPGALLIGALSALTGFSLLAFGLYFLPVALVRIVGTAVGLRGRRTWLLATVYCVVYGLLGAAFLLLIWRVLVNAT